MGRISKSLGCFPAQRSEFQDPAVDSREFLVRHEFIRILLWFQDQESGPGTIDFSVLRVILRKFIIPLGNVEKLTETGWPRMRHVKLELKVRSEFDDSIWFIPKGNT